ncbi:hypothetical protein ACM9HF_15350 [Colwellia sp. RE-S-Sl-9]
MNLSEKYQSFKNLYHIVFNSPTIQLSLQLDKTKGNEPFFESMTRKYYKDATAKHPKMPLFGKLTRGVAVCELNGDFELYLKGIESSGRRNIKKAKRLGYTFERINFNEYLDGVWDIRKSTSVRQGKMPDDFVNKRPTKHSNPKSKTNTHDYPYFGVFSEKNELVAYAGCFLAGDVIELSHYYGHADHQKNGVTPLLITSIAEYVIQNHTHIKAYTYGGYIGASPTLKRFKKKFSFLPHRVIWSL